MKISSVVLLIAFSWVASGSVGADSRQQQRMPSLDDGGQRLGNSSSIRYQDPFFSLSYRYNDSGLSRHNRYPLLGPGLRHRHTDWGFGQHRRPPKYGYGQQHRRFSAHNRGDRYRNRMRTDRYWDAMRRDRYSEHRDRH